MTTPEQIIAKIEEIEKINNDSENLFATYEDSADFLDAMLRFKQTAIRVFNLPTADSPDDSPGQSDMET
jgi:hypothetical protein